MKLPALLLVVALLSSCSAVIRAGLGVWAAFQILGAVVAGFVVFTYCVVGALALRDEWRAARARKVRR
jgi:hypothetical protein